MFSSAKYPAPVTSFPALGTGYIVSRAWHWLKGPGKRGHIVADTLLPTQMFPRLPARATFVADTNFVPGTQKMSLISFRNILCPQQLFPSLRSPRNIMGNNVSPFTRALMFLSHYRSERNASIWVLCQSLQYTVKNRHL